MCGDGDLFVSYFKFEEWLLVSFYFFRPVFKQLKVLRVEIKFELIVFLFQLGSQRGAFSLQAVNSFSERVKLLCSFLLLRGPLIVLAVVFRDLTQVTCP